MQWVASTLHTTSEHDVSSITTADAAHLCCQQSTELTTPGRFKWTRPFRAKDEICFLRVFHHISTGLYLLSGVFYNWYLAHINGRDLQSITLVAFGSNLRRAFIKHAQNNLSDTKTSDDDRSRRVTVILSDFGQNPKFSIKYFRYLKICPAVVGACLLAKRSDRWTAMEKASSHFP